MSEAALRQASIYVDETHCGGRHVTGLERITLELFSSEALSPLALTPIRASSRIDMALRQNFALPLKGFRDRDAIVLTPGFPPACLATLLGARVIPYIHDLFLISRWSDLNLTAKAYMSGPFRLAVRTLPRFMVNSETTAVELRLYCRAAAAIHLYRPEVRNVFGLDTLGRAENVSESVAPRLVAIGTVEPRKNLLAAAEIVQALRATGHPEASLDIVGRIGWGDAADRLAGMPGVRLHGYKPIGETREIVRQSDALISTSHDEGLGLPLLEAQYAGLPVIAPDKAVFREVLGASGVFIEPTSPVTSAATIAALFKVPDWRRMHMSLAHANLERWNAAARSDRAGIIALLTSLTSRRDSHAG